MEKGFCTISKNWRFGKKGPGSWNNHLKHNEKIPVSSEVRKKISWKISFT